jgi:hypothetical protein
MNVNLRIGLPTSLLVLGVFYLLCVNASGEALLRQARVDSHQLEHGIRWDMNDRGELIGGTAVEFPQWSMHDSVLTASSADGSGYLPLDLGNRMLDAAIFSKLRISIDVSKDSRLALFHREILGGPILSTDPIGLERGHQTLEVDLADLNWNANRYDDEGRAIGPTQSSRWGGASGRISSLRIHPAIALGVEIVIDRIELLPATPIRDRPLVSVRELNSTSHPAPIVQLPRWPWRPDLIERQIRTIQQLRPAASALFACQTPPLADKVADTAVDGDPHLDTSGFPMALAALGILIALSGLVYGPMTRGRAAAVLAGLVLCAAWLLLEPGLPGPAGSQSYGTLLLMMGLMGTIPLAALKRPSSLGGSAPAQLLGSRASWRNASWICLVACLPLLVLVTMGDVRAADSSRLLARLLGYLPWALVQQSMLCLLLVRLTRRLDGDGRLAAATLFGLGHYPNFGVMVATFILALVCLQHFRRYHALLPLSVLHALLGTLYLELGSPSLLLSGAIGQRFFG